MPQTLLITGANRGIGLALARAACARGDAVIAAARDPQAASALHALRAGGAALEVAALDVADPASGAALAATLAGRPIDALVCNAGVLVGSGGLEDPELDAAGFARMLAANVIGPWLTVRALLPNLRAARGARVAVVTSSMGSSTRAKGTALGYRASKAAATNLALNLAAALRPEGIAVAALDPGWTRTDMGGPDAELAPETSAAGLLARLDALTLARSGVVETWAGAPLPL